MRWRAFAAAAVALGLAGGSGIAQPAPAARPAESASPTVQHLTVPHPDVAVGMRTKVVRPDRPGAFPLAIVSHGSSEDAGWRASHEPPPYRALTGLLLGLGYAVAVPQRPGHGPTGGPYLEGAYRCEGADFARSGHATARAIDAVVQHLRRQSYVQAKRVLLLGHSAGAWGSLALASRFPDRVEGVVNFSGGRGGRSHDLAHENCAPDRLIAAARDFGRSTRVPSLWIYAENDSYFGPLLVRKMVEAYRSGGAPAQLQMLPPVGDEGHFLIEADKAFPLWRPPVRQFIRKHGSG